MLISSTYVMLFEKHTRVVDDAKETAENWFNENKVRWCIIRSVAGAKSSLKSAHWGSRITNESIAYDHRSYHDHFPTLNPSGISNWNWSWSFCSNCGVLYVQEKKWRMRVPRRRFTIFYVSFDFNIILDQIEFMYIHSSIIVSCIYPYQKIKKGWIKRCNCWERWNIIPPSQILYRMVPPSQILYRMDKAYRTV